MRLGTYKGIRMPRPNTEVTEHEVMNVLKKKQKEYAVATNIDDRSARTGDQAILDSAIMDKRFHTEMEKTLH